MALTGDSQFNSLFPFQSNYITIAGYQMHYIDEGEGNDIVLLLHGNPTWSFYYRNLILALKDEYRVIAIDHLGCGLSEKPDVFFRARDRINHLKEFIEALKINKFSLVMHDWGGPIGTFVAIDMPEKIKKIIYLNTTLMETELLPPVIKISASRIIGKVLTQNSKFFLKLTTWLGTKRKLTSAEKKGYLYPYKKRKERKSIWGFVVDIPFNSSHPTFVEMKRLSDGLDRLNNIPIKIIWGLKDPCFHRGILAKLSNLFPQADVVEIPYASHLVLEDAPDKVIYEIKKFLSQHQLESERGFHIKQTHPLFSAFEDIACNNLRKTAVLEPFFIGNNIKYSQTKYQDILSLVYSYQRGLINLGLEPGDRVLMLVTPGMEFLALTYAVIAGGGIPIFLDSGMGREKLFSCIKEAEPNIFIGSTKAHLLRLKSKELFPKLKFHITASDWIYLGGVNLSLLKKYAPKKIKPLYNEEGIGLIAYTSGATGRPKGVVFTYGMLKEQLRIFQEDFGLEVGKRDLPLLPIFSIFNLALGVTSVFPPVNPSAPISLDPFKVVKVIEDADISYSFGAPTLWGKIAEYCLRTKIDFPYIEKIFTAGAPITLDVAQQIKAIIPNGELLIVYGATEALPVSCISGSVYLSNKNEEDRQGNLGVLVGKPVRGIQVKVIDANVANKELSPYHTGEIIVSGKNVSPEYFKLPDITAAAKIYEDGKFWHKMGDMGYLDKEGNIYFCGRKAHLARYKGMVFYSVPIENIVNKHFKINRSALVSLDSGEPALVVEPKPEYWTEDEKEKEVLTQEIKDLCKHNAFAKEIKTIFFYKDFPVDPRHNAKINREALQKFVRDYVKELNQAA